MKHIIVFIVFITWILNASGSIAIVPRAGEMEQYAANELQRYYYQLTGILLPIDSVSENVSNAQFILICKSDEPPRKVESSILQFVDASAITEQAYQLKTVKIEGRKKIIIYGGGPAGLLYGVYGLLEDHLGIAFYLSGDVVPEKKKSAGLPDVNEVKVPEMKIRGFLPWTNFPQSATVYSWNDWKFILDQMAKMRMNFLHIHNYNGFCGHNEMYHNFSYKNYISRSWMATAKSGHGWACPGWEINQYKFGASDLFDDYDFGADCALHNEYLSNYQVFRKGISLFQQVIHYAHSRGIKIGLGLDIDVNMPEYKAEPYDEELVEARVSQLANDYPDLDYLLCFQSENPTKDTAFYNRWNRTFDAFYAQMKRQSPHTRFAVSGWGLTAESVSKLPEDVICAPISHYSASCENGEIYGNREYWGCPWLERDFNSSEYYYPYHMDLSETIKAYQNRAKNMTGFYALTWRLTDAIEPKMWYISKASWDHHLNTSSDVYGRYARTNYGPHVGQEIIDIINQNEPFASNWGECQETPPFNPEVNTYYDFYQEQKKLHPEYTAQDAIRYSLTLAEKQLATISGQIDKTVQKGYRYRLNLLKNRIEGVKYHVELNARYDSLQWADLPFCFPDWVESFSNRITDISTLGNIQSLQNRFIQLNYLKKVNSLSGYQQVRSPSVMDVKGTEKGAELKWRDEDHNTRYFRVYRNGEKIDELAYDRSEYTDDYNGKAIYTIRTVDADGNVSPASIPSGCLAGNADTVAPHILVISPPVSQNKNESFVLKAIIKDNRRSSLLSAVIFYRETGTKEWKNEKMILKSRSTFIVTLDIGTLKNGLEYYIEANDGKNTAYYPVEAPEINRTVVFYDPVSSKKPESPVISGTDSLVLTWEKSPSPIHRYNIYRSTSPDFKADGTHFLTYVSNECLSYRDFPMDFEGKPMNGNYYYKVTAADFYGNESAASNVKTINY